MDCHQRGQPILVGTVSIEKSERLSELLDAYEYEVDGRSKKGIPHNVLNARYHEQEALIVADAGTPGAVTIATNMAGRGTDIQLGGNVEMKTAKWRQEQKSMGLEPTPEEALAYQAQVAARDRRHQGRRRLQRAASSYLEPSGTKAGGSTTSSEAARAVRATPATPSSSSPARTICSASLL